MGEHWLVTIQLHHPVESASMFEWNEALNYLTGNGPEKTADERMYSYIKAYVEEHGKLPLWPRGQLAPDGRTMDGWIAVQRTRLSNDKVPSWQKNKLNEIGIYPFETSNPEKNIHSVQL